MTVGCLECCSSTVKVSAPPHATLWRLSRTPSLGTGGETVVFSDSFIKINRKDKQQDRAMLVTTKAVYNCKSSNLSKCKRRIALTSIEGITQSTVSDEFVLHVPSEYDYRFMGPRKSEAIEWIQTARERLTGKSIPVTQSSQVVLKSVTLTRVEAAKRKVRAAPLPQEPRCSWKMLQPCVIVVPF